MTTQHPKIHELLERDPKSIGLANQGQARIRAERTDQATAELRLELESFVCDGEYGRAIERILSRYLESLRKPKQSAAWVAGFFGSGKSHLLKMLAHLWVDTPFSDGVSARTLVRGLPDDVRAHLRELDTQAARAGVQLKAPAGTLPSGSGDHVRATILSVILDACDLPTQYPQAEFVFWAREQGFEKALKDAVQGAGKEWLSELNNLYVSPIIAKTLLALDPQFATSDAQARETLRARFPKLHTDITTAQLTAAARKALIGKGGLPLTLLVLDEVQQYLADSADRSQTITEATEAIATQLDSRVMLVASGQSALGSTPNLMRLRDRFPVHIQLSDADVEAVTRKVLLGKKETAKQAIKENLDRNAGEVSRHLGGTRIAPRPSDVSTALADYPLLPCRRRFWEECFRAVDAQGTQSQLRSQLKILHEAITRIADRNLGAVIPADLLFEALSASLVNTGVLLGEINTRIAQLDDGTPEGVLKRRICGLVFMIGRMPREQAVDIGVRATPAMIADLLVEDLNVDSGPLRSKVDTALKELADSGILMQVGPEYRHQTTEGAEWDRAFRERFAAVTSNAAEIESKRTQLFGAAVQVLVGGLKLTHGVSKTPRAAKLHAGLAAPPPGDSITVWLRDQWSGSQAEVLRDAQARGVTDPTIHLFLPRRGDVELAKAIAEIEAAQGVLNQRGSTSTPAGHDARQNMHTRLDAAKAAATSVVRDIVAAAQVLQGGGTEVFGADTASKLQSAAEQSLTRLYPQFDDADNDQWGVVIRRARDGSDEPLKPVGWNGPTPDHTVCKEVLKQIGPGALGSKVRGALKAPPFGWPQDAIDAALIALHRAGVVRVAKNGVAIAPGQLDQAGVGAAEFRSETVVVSVGDKLAARSVIAALGVQVRAGEEELKCVQCLEAARALLNRATGPAPAPLPPSSALIDGLAPLSGGALVVAVAQKKDELIALAEGAKKQAEEIERLLPAWRELERLAKHAAPLASCQSVHAEVDAVRANRSLLASPDPVAPLATSLANELRGELARSHQSLIDALSAADATLSSDDSWGKLQPTDQIRLREQFALSPAPPLAVKTNAELLTALDSQSLAARTDAAAAVPTRVAGALAEAARLLQPKAQRLKLAAVTLSTEVDVKAWIADHEAKLLALVKEGPVTVG